MLDREILEYGIREHLEAYDIEYEDVDKLHMIIREEIEEVFWDCKGQQMYTILGNMRNGYKSF